MSNISITFTVWHICLLFLALLIGVLLGCFLTLNVFKWAFAEKVSFKGKRNGRKRKHEKRKAEKAVHKQRYRDDDEEEDSEEVLVEETETKPEQSQAKPIEESTDSIQAVSEPKYQEGSVLKTKMKRDHVLNLFDLDASADGVSLAERIKQRQSREDASYSILKDGMKKEETQLSETNQ